MGGATCPCPMTKQTKNAIKRIKINKIPFGVGLQTTLSTNQNNIVMTAKDIVLMAFGFGTADNKIDDIIDEFNIELTTSDVEEIVSNGGVYDLENELIQSLYDKVIDKSRRLYDTSDEDFETYINAQCSSLYYCGDEVYCMEDIKRIKSENEGETEN